LAFPSFLVANAAVFAAVLIVIYGVVIAVEQRRSRRQLPPRPGAGGRALEGERRGDTGDGPVPLVPAPARPAPTCGLTAHGRVGRIPPGGMPGRRAAYGRYRAPGNRPRSPFSLVRPYVCRFWQSSGHQLALPPPRMRGWPPPGAVRRPGGRRPSSSSAVNLAAGRSSTGSCPSGTARTIRSSPAAGRRSWRPGCGTCGPLACRLRW
jgi:hypothetical protein